MRGCCLFHPSDGPNHRRLLLDFRVLFSKFPFPKRYPPAPPSGGSISPSQLIERRINYAVFSISNKSRSLFLTLLPFRRRFLMSPPFEPVPVEERPEREEGEMAVGEEEEEKEPEKSGTWGTELAETTPWPVLRFDVPPRRVYHFWQQFRTGASPSDNFPKGVKWSPDGSCFLTSSDDNTLRLFYLPEEAFNDRVAHEAAVDDQDSYAFSIMVSEAETVYDFCWYPYMYASDPTTCVFASTTRDHPIHLWDAISGQLRCTYRAYDAMDEITAALSISFNSSGTKLFAGYNKALRVFDVHRPGRDFDQYSLQKGNDGPSGIVSSIAFSPTYSGMFAIGSYSQTTTVYAEDNMEALYVLHGQEGGVTQVLFSKDGNYLYTGGRKDPYILCWDIRNTAGVVYKLYRSAECTNQRISFDIEPCGRHLGTGGQDGLVHIYDLQTGQWIAGFQVASDTVNCFSFHPSLPLAASSSGNRRFGMPDNLEENLSLHGDENCFSVWSFSCPEEVNNAAADDEAFDHRNILDHTNKTEETFELLE